MTNNKLNVGDEYLSIALDVDILLAKVQRAIVAGKEKVYVAAFKNKDAEPHQPIYKSDSVAIWKKKKEDREPVVSTEDI